MDTSNGIPKRITPDCLVDSIIEITVESDFKDEFIERIVLESIKMSYPESEFREFPIYGKEGGKHFFANDIFRIYVCSSLISINIVSKYTGWDVLNRFVKDSLQGLYNVETPILKFQQVRIKYVSRFPQVSIFDVWDGNPIQLNHIPTFLGRQFSFNFSIFSDEKKLMGNARVRIDDQLPLPEGKGVYSRIDVGLEAVKGDGSWDVIYEQLQMLHNNEKEIFFRLLSREFVEKMNPVW